MTNKERAQRIEDDFYNDNLKPLKPMIERALDEKDRWWAEQYLQAKISGQREMRERAAKEIATIGKEKHPYRRSGPYLISRIRALPIDGEESKNKIAIEQKD